MKKNCPSCRNEPAIQHNTFGLLPGKKCQKRQAGKSKNMRNAPFFDNPAQADRVQSQRDHHLGDLQQPWLPDGTPNRTFAEANKDVVHDYYSQEELESLV